MSAPFHLVCHALLGTYVAWRHRAVLNDQQHTLGWPILVALIAASVLLVPATTYQTRMYPCHAAGYSLSPELQPELWAYLGPITLVLVLLNMGTLMLGYACMKRTLIAGRTTVAAGVACALACGTAITAAIYHDRAFSYGSTHAFWDHRAAGFLDTPSAWLCLMAYGACIATIHRAPNWARRLSAPST